MVFVGSARDGGAHGVAQRNAMRPRRSCCDPDAGHPRLLRAAALLIAIVSAVAMPPATAQSLSDTHNVYLMELSASSYTLAESVVTHEIGSEYFLHFEPFLQAVEFPIQRQGNVWSGWFRRQDNRFSWNVDSGAVRITRDAGEEISSARWVETREAGSTHRREDRLWIETNEGIFVSNRALEAWFDLELEVNTHLQSVTIRSTDPLPFEQRLARATAKDSFRQASSSDSVPIPDQYRWVTTPLADVLVNHRVWQNGADSDTLYDSTDVTLTAGMDLLKHAARYAVVTGDKTLQRLTIERRAATPDGTLLLGANRYALGDVFPTNSNLVTGGGEGVGFRIQRHRGGFSGNQYTITGDAIPGWETELYRNGVLITFGSVGSDGRYVFADQEVVYGENIFLVRLFGPRGEIEERRHVYWGGGLELPKGDYDFNISHIDFTSRFLDGEREGISGLPSARTTDARYGYALTDNLQIGAGYTWAELGSRQVDGRYEEQEYATLDARMNLGRGLLLTELVDQRTQGTAWSLQYLTTLNAQNLTFSHQSFRDFESPFTVHRLELDAENQVAISGPVNLAFLKSYLLRVSHLDRADSGDDFRIFNRLGAHWGPVNLSNDFEYFDVANGEPIYRGNLRLSGRRGAANFRAQLDYGNASEKLVSQVSAAVTWNINRDLNTKLTVRRNVGGERETYVESVSTIGLGMASVSLNLFAGTDESWAVALGFSTGFGRDTDSANHSNSRASLAHTGRATLNLFLDSNNNGSWDAGEEPVQWAAYRNRHTSEAGGIRLSGVPANTPIHVRSRDIQLEDSFMRPADEVYELYTHAGSDIDVYVPIAVTGDVEGYLYPGRGMSDADVRGITVALYDSDGNEIATTVSEYDGYYSFNGIATGDYRVMVVPYPDRAGYHLQRFSLGTEDNYVLLDPVHLWKR